MPGPMPKDPAIRQRQNKAATRAQLVATDAPRKRAPRLPTPVEGYKWHPFTRAWWRDVWRSPMAAEYVTADLHGLYRLAVLVDEFWKMPSTRVAGEIRLEQQLFGLTPLDRRRLEWSIAQNAEAEVRRAQRRVRAAHDGDIDPREALRAVK